MLFGTFPRLSAVNSFSITLNNNVIKRVFHFTYLGIVCVAAAGKVTNIALKPSKTGLLE